MARSFLHSIKTKFTVNHFSYIQLCLREDLYIYDVCASPMNASQQAAEEGALLSFTRAVCRAVVQEKWPGLKVSELNF